MKVSVFGLGYVGCVSVACLSRLRHHVIGVDVVESKVRAIANGIASVVEPQVDELLTEGHLAKRITATTNAEEAVLATDATLICVGTPTGRDGSHDLSAVMASARAIGEALKKKTEPHLVIMRSTVAPGTVEGLLVPAILGPTGKTKCPVSIVIVPEYLRECTAVRDYFDAPLTVVGTADGKPDVEKGAIAALMAVDPERIEWVQYKQAEMLKTLCNVFHAMKVAFANEVGSLCNELGVDGRAVMRLLTMDRKLNISPAYLRPGMAYGGSCLPKDLSAVVSLATKHCVDVPLLRSIGLSNEAHKERAYDAVLQLNGHRKIAMDGLAFKPGTDDLRESPMVTIAEYLIGKGYDLRILDPAVKSARLTGANRDYIDHHIPHLADRLVGTTEELLEHAEALVLTRDENDLFNAAKQMSEPPLVIDLTGAGRFIDPEEAMTPTPAIVLSDVKPTLKRVKAASRPRPVTAARRA
jgi:GDP-mannose 6-dehydrogenase